MKDELTRIREWAQARLDALQEPPWTAGRCQHLIALIDEMQAAQTQRAGNRARGDNIVPFASKGRRAALLPGRLRR